MNRLVVSLMVLGLSFLSAEEVYATFIVEAKKSADLAFSASGIVNKVNVEIGSSVKKGQKLVVLKNSDVRSLLNIAKANLKTAQVSANYAQKEYKRQSQVKSLVDASTINRFEQNRDVSSATISQLEASLQTAQIAANYAQEEYARQLQVKHLLDASTFDKFIQNRDITQAKVLQLQANIQTAQVTENYAQTEYDRQSESRYFLDASDFDRFAQSRDVSRATVSQLKANVQYQEILLGKTALYAPFNGVIYEKLVEVGDVVSGQMIRTILKIQSSHDVKLIVTFDEKYWESVKKGAVFKYKLTGSEKQYEGKISKVYPTIDTKTHKLKAEVNAKDIKVGLFGTGTIITE